MKYLILSIGLIGGISYLCSSDSKTYTIHITEDSLAEMDTAFTTPFKHTTKCVNTIEICSNDTILFLFKPNSTAEYIKRSLSLFETTYIEYLRTKECNKTPISKTWSSMSDAFPFRLEGSGMTLYYNKLKAKEVDITVTTTFWGY